MTIWDQGTYTSYKNPDNPVLLMEEYENGTLHLLFHGYKLQGKFSLVRTNYDKKDQWLLFKQKDKYSTEEDYDAENFPSLDEEELEDSSSVRSNSTDNDINDF